MVNTESRPGEPSESHGHSEAGDGSSRSGGIGGGKHKHRLAQEADAVEDLACVGGGQDLA